MATWPNDVPGRLALSMEVIFDMLGIPNDNGLVLAMNQLTLEQRFRPTKLEFYQALWIQFRESPCGLSGARAAGRTAD